MIRYRRYHPLIFVDAMSWLQLANRTAIVTGAASGIGAAVTKALLAANCRVVLADRNPNSMEQVVAESFISLGAPKENGHDVSSSTLMVECDVTHMDQVTSLMQQADHFAAKNKDDDFTTAGGRSSSSSSRSNSSSSSSSSSSMSTLLVNCAGITRDNWISKMTLDEWDDVMDVNLKGTFLTCRAFLDQERMKRFQQQQQQQMQSSSSIDNIKPAAAESHDPWYPTRSSSSSSSSSSNASTVLSIVNVGSIVSEYGNLGQANYAASKGGVVGLTRALAKESAKRNVRVNAVLPGFIDTPMAQAVPDMVKEQVILPKIPMGRFGRPDEIADVVTFLLSPRSSYMTGECVRVSGMISL